MSAANAHAVQALSSLSRAEFNREALLHIARFAAGQALRPSVWGFAFPLVAVLILAGFRRIGTRDQPELMTLLLAATAMALAVVGFYYAASFCGPSLGWWLGTGFSRMVMPAGVLAMVLALVVAFPERAGAPHSPSPRDAQ